MIDKSNLLKEYVVINIYLFFIEHLYFCKYVRCDNKELIELN
jgi:hypothetical protein